MTCFVDIRSIWRGGSRGSGTADILIWTEWKGQRHESGPYTVTVIEGSRNQLAIMAVNEALKHFQKPGQDIRIRMAEQYVRANLQYLEIWHANDYKRRGGKKVANEMEWRTLWMHCRNHRITIELKEEYAAV